MKHAGQINTPSQLALHAGLGYIMGEVGYGNGLAGAAGGVVGEGLGISLNNKGVSKDAAIAMSSAIGALVGGLVSGNPEGVIAASAIASNAVENNAYFTKRPLGTKPGKINDDPGSFEDYHNWEASHEQLFFEDEQGGNIGFFNDRGSWFSGKGEVRSDDEGLLGNYKPIDQNTVHYDDDIMRQAVKNVGSPDRYNLCLYNCQDYANSLRYEYAKIEFNRNNPDIPLQIYYMQQILGTGYGNNSNQLIN